MSREQLITAARSANCPPEVVAYLESWADAILNAHAAASTDTTEPEGDDE